MPRRQSVAASQTTSCPPAPSGVLQDVVLVGDDELVRDGRLQPDVGHATRVKDDRVGVSSRTRLAGVRRNGRRRAASVGVDLTGNERVAVSVEELLLGCWGQGCHVITSLDCFGLQAFELSRAILKAQRVAAFHLLLLAQFYD